MCSSGRMADKRGQGVTLQCHVTLAARFRRTISAISCFLALYALSLIVCLVTWETSSSSPAVNPELVSVTCSVMKFDATEASVAASSGSGTRVSVPSSATDRSSNT